MSDATKKSPLDLAELLEDPDQIPLAEGALTQRILRVQAYALIEIVRELRHIHDAILEIGP